MQERRRPPATLVLGTIALAAVVTSAASFVLGARPADERADAKLLTIVAIPFAKCAARDTALDYRPEEMPDEMLNAVRRVPGIWIVGRNAARRYKDRDTVDERTVERELGVRFLVTGTYQQSGGRLIVSAQLNDSMTRGELWAGSFSRHVATRFAEQ